MPGTAEGDDVGVDVEFGSLVVARRRESLILSDDRGIPRSVRLRNSRTVDSVSVAGHVENQGRALCQWLCDVSCESWCWPAMTTTIEHLTKRVCSGSTRRKSDHLSETGLSDLVSRRVQYRVVPPDRTHERERQSSKRVMLQYTDVRGFLHTKPILPIRYVRAARFDQAILGGSLIDG